jgi:PAS domain S-box-containing protein
MAVTAVDPGGASRVVEAQEPGRAASRRAKTELERARDIRFEPVAAIVAGAFLGWGAIFIKATITEAIGGDPGYIVLVAAVIAAAWVGGMVAGLTAVIVTFVLNGLIYGGPGISPADPVELWRQVIYGVVSVALVVLVRSRRVSRDRLADALDEAANLAEEIESRDARLELMLSASRTGFWEWDVVTGELLWSEAIFEQHGLDPAGRPPSFPAYLEMIHPDDRGRFQEGISEALDGTAPFSLEFRIVWADGSVHWTHGAARVFRDDEGAATRMLGTGQDITTRRQLQDERDELLAEERRAAEFREAFIDVISHELRTPITTILGITQILTRPGRPDDPVARMALMEDVRSETERLHRLVEDLLILSRVERGRLEVDTEPLEPRRLLTRIVNIERTELPNIEIDLTMEPDLPIVAGEATYVEQVVRNMLGNAAKYTGPGTAVVVDVRREGDDVAIRVLDDGPGVAEDSLPYLFDLFYRDPDSARTVAGSGIGLFVCSSLVASMGGRIWARRRETGGSEFGFTLRVAKADDDAVAATAPRAVGATAAPD